VFLAVVEDVYLFPEQMSPEPAHHPVLILAPPDLK